MSWWRLLLSRLRALFASAPKRLVAKRNEEQTRLALPQDLQQALASLGAGRGAVRDAVGRATSDFADLRDVLMGPGASSDAADDVSLIAEAEDVLRSMLDRAPSVQSLVAIAAKRDADKEGRAAAGEALLKLRDQGRALQQLATASLLWASSGRREDLEGMQALAEELRTLVLK